MDQFQTSVMLALLPTTVDWCRIELPHMTLVYAGEIQDLPPTAHNDLAKSALSIAMACPQLSLDVLGVDVFGEEKQVDALIFRETPELSAMRSMVEHWNASQHPFNPHATIGPVGSGGDNVPTRLVFDRIIVQWGDSQLTYRLR